MNKNRALKLALGALEQIAFAEMLPSIEMSDKAIEKWHARKAWKFIEIAKSKLKPIKEALAQPEQEPVAHMYADDYERMLNSETFCTVYSVAVGSPTRGETTIELFTTPPQRPWVGLTDAEIDSYFEDHGWSPSEDYYPVIKDIEDKLKELNT